MSDARPLRIGRAPDCDYRHQDPSVSRLHAELSREADGRYLLVDRQSTQGTAVLDRNGQAQSITRTWVAPEDRVQFGAVTVSVRDILAAAGRRREAPRPDPGSPKIRCVCGAVKTQGARCHVCGRP